MASPSTDKRGNGRRVAVTGAAGYLGSHVVRELLEQGFRVRAVVRDADNEEKVAHLRTLVAEAADRIEFVGADLLTPNSHDDALKGCELVCHMASSVRLTAKDPQREIVDVAVQGTRNVLDSVRRIGTVRRVVLTSSVAAVAGEGKPEGHLYNEADWNETASLEDSPYMLSKTLAERAAWQFLEALPPAERFELVAVNPVVVLGPLYARHHRRSSPATVLELCRRKMPACPRLHLGIVDVRDVAVAHVRALTRPEASGRYILAAHGLWMQEIAQILAAEFPALRIPTARLPDLLMYGAALFDKRLSFKWVRKNLGRITRLDNTRSERDLGITYRPVRDSLIDTCRSFLELGLVKQPG